jgi:DNA repair photolyase
LNIKEIQAKTILRKHKKVESWFLTIYSMNLYRGCTHNCVYCDGRYEKYQVDGNFGEDVIVKTNAIEILKKELDPKRKRKPMKKGFIGLGGGVGDSYQPAEKKYNLCRKVLHLFYNYHFPIHILTKSTLIEKDVDIIKKINKQNRAIISFSFSSTDDDLSSIFEPGVPLPSERLETIKFFKKEGVFCGMYLMPVIPFITDKENIIEKSIRDAKNAGIDFVIFGGMTLKEGGQKDYFIKIIKKRFPDLISKYNAIYKNNFYGNTIKSYNDHIHNRFKNGIKKNSLPSRIPPNIFTDIIDENDKIIVILEHIDYLLKLRGLSSSYGYAAYSLSKLNDPISVLKNDILDIKGIDKKTEKIINEIIKTGRSSYYEMLLNI